MKKKKNFKLRQTVAVNAAKLMYYGEEKEYFAAKRKAARNLGHKNEYYNLPSNKEIKDQILEMAEIFEGEERLERLGFMRCQALIVMKILHHFHPKLIGSVLKGHIREGSDIDIHAFSDSASAISMMLEDEQFECETERKKVIKHNIMREFVHVYTELEDCPVEITIYPRKQKNFPFKSSITRDVMERASISELEELIRREHPEMDWVVEV